MAALSSDHSLHTAAESLAGVDNALFGQVVPFLHNGCLQGVHDRVRCPVSIPLQSPPIAKCNEFKSGEDDGHMSLGQKSATLSVQNFWHLADVCEGVPSWVHT
uniref:Uncharacterized protein n=1 Tax=Lepeophtheirus salmonis TaxID=72036 RepID=A0A0K2TLR8_LEPSM